MPEAAEQQVKRLSDEEAERRALVAGEIFTPAAPIDERALFAGRTEQLRKVIDAIQQRGQHAIIFGERGVGKTSLANVLSSFLEGTRGKGRPILAPRINCDSGDAFSTLWRKVFSQIELSGRAKIAGFGAEGSTATPFSESLPDQIRPDDVRQALTVIAGHALVIVILDEFDRLPRSHVRRLIADTIKGLSDHSVPATLVLVGVGDSVNQLIEEHASIERALVQIPMPRMSGKEIREIVLKGLQRLEMAIEDEALEMISFLSQGLPHYTHLLALHASRQALDNRRDRVTREDVKGAIRKSLDGAHQTTRTAYHKATSSPRKDNLYAKVLLACALADADDMGYFAAADVREPMRRITGKKYDIPSFSRHLNDFCEDKRGAVLEKIGAKHRFRFRFSNPLMQPFVIMQGVADEDILARIASEQ